MKKNPYKLSVLDLVPVYENESDSHALQRAVELAQAAERLGYTRYWAAEHHDMPHLACPSPEVLLAHIGARTERIRLGSGALLLPHYSPLKVAESFRMLAALYPGRMDLGIGRAPGGKAHASMALSGNFLENVRQMPNKLEGVVKLLQDSYTYEGEAVSARPNPPEEPEIWLLGTNRKSAEYAASSGMGYVFGQFMSDTDAGEVLRAYREAFVPSAQLEEPKVILTVGAICAETDEEARQWADSSAALYRDEKQQEAALPYSEDKLLVGTAESIHGRISQLSELYDADEFMLVTHIPDYNKRQRSYELLAGGFAN
ncbi:LLM class flavin-dependent oxidoreductase [Paenibacillus senegalensis]|uniref:LLM class flavin-dependent oxidoreductase n=1 Tax=Paenibacillus senegalensis TaxID=1465766 RepID=UPI0002895A59|nr:LLM class flavin-dependent oxidoreductase [Paenibacillus senegalensis]